MLKIVTNCKIPHYPIDEEQETCCSYICNMIVVTDTRIINWMSFSKGGRTGAELQGLPEERSSEQCSWKRDFFKVFFFRILEKRRLKREISSSESQKKDFFKREVFSSESQKRDFFRNPGKETFFSHNPGGYIQKCHKLK